MMRASLLLILKCPRMIDPIVDIIEDKDRSYISYPGNGRRQGLDILNRHNVKEVIDLTVNTIKEPTGRAGPRVRNRVKLLKTFGAEAKYIVPQLRELLGKQANKIIKIIEASETPRKMISVEEVKKAAAKK